jgi:hypothetical protein
VIGKIRALCEIVTTDYKVGDIVDTRVKIVMPIERGNRVDKVTKEKIAPYFLKRVDIFYNAEKLYQFHMDLAMTSSPEIYFKVKVVGNGLLKAEFFDSNEKRLIIKECLIK